MDVVVDQRGEQVVGDADGVKVAGEVKIDVRHRHHLREAAARRASLHAEYGTERRLAQADRRFLPDPVQGIAQADGRRRLAFARRRGTDRRNENELPVRPARLLREPLERYLPFRAAVRFERLVRNSEPRGNLADGFELGLLRDLDVGLHEVFP